MTRTYRLLLGALALVGSLSCGGAQAPITDTGAALVIVHRDNPAQPTPDELRAYFIGKVHHWAHGPQIEVIDRIGNPPPRAAMLRGLLGHSEEEYDRLVITESYQSGWTGPRRVATDREVLRFVASRPGAIGVIAPKSLTSEVAASVRVVLRL